MHASTDAINPLRTEYRLNVQTTTTAVTTIRHGNTIERSRRAKRTRRARLSYPAALVELALLLCATADKRDVASALGVGISTVYRWVGTHRTAWMSRDSLRTDGSLTRTADVISVLSARCEHAGFRVSPSLVNRNANAARSASEPIIEDGVDTHRIPEIDEIAANDVVATESMIHAKREIETKYTTRLSCQRMAATVDMSRIKFIKEFASTFGVPPYHYLLGIRVKRAIELLQYSNASLPIVAATTGFGSAASMHRAFKRFAGASPGTVVKAIAPKRNFAFANSVQSPMPAVDQT
jgi:AraC-like DNA-binding protein